MWPAARHLSRPCRASQPLGGLLNTAPLSSRQGAIGIQINRRAPERHHRQARAQVQGGPSPDTHGDPGQWISQVTATPPQRRTWPAGSWGRTGPRSRSTRTRRADGGRDAHRQRHHLLRPGGLRIGEWSRGRLQRLEAERVEAERALGTTGPGAHKDRRQENQCLWSWRTRRRSRREAAKPPASPRNANGAGTEVWDLVTASVKEAVRSKLAEATTSVIPRVERST